VVSEALPATALVEGNRLPFAPEWQGHVGVSYDAYMGNFILTPRVDASYQGATFFDATNTPEIAQLDDYTVVNASLVLATRGGRVSASTAPVLVAIPRRFPSWVPVAAGPHVLTGTIYRP
jgi:hypothetical protein